MSETVAAQGKAQDALKEQIETVATKADEAAKTATKTDEAVNGRVTTSPAPDGRRKADVSSAGGPPLEDTAMSSLHKR